MTRQGSTRSADVLFDPRSITVVGANATAAKWGHKLSRRALESCGGRPVLLVNRRGVEVLGRPTHRTIGDASDALGVPVDLVVVCVPAPELVPAVTDAVTAGARSVVVITAGLAELGAAGASVEREVVDLVRSAGAVLLGPNCLGVVDTSTQLQLSHDLVAEGSVAVISQSGNVALDLAAMLADRGLGVSRFVSLGNQADLTSADLMATCADHEATRAVALYVEDVADGQAFVSAARRLADAGKPVVLVAPGRSAAAVRGAVSHTGALTTSSAVIDAVCASVGAHRVENLTQLADLLQGLLVDRRMPGRSAVVLTDGGGHGAIAADALAASGLDTPVLGGATQTSLRGVLWRNSAVSNPVDLAGAGDHDPLNYTRALATLLVADDVDGVLLTGYFGTYSSEPSPMAAHEVDAAREMAKVVQEQGKPVVVHTMSPQSPTGRLLHAAGIPVHRDVDRAAAVLARLVEPQQRDLAPLPLPAPAPPVAETSYAAARELFARAGVPFAAAQTVRDVAELETALASTELVFPLVLKALGAPHKSEGGGVVLGLRDRDEVRAAFADLQARLAPPTVSVEVMVDTSRGVELVVGCVRDPRFGPVLMVGLGGVLAEVLADTAVALAPVSPAGARQLLLSLRGAAVLRGARGRDPVDLDALARAVALVSEVAAAHPELTELEVNPLLAGAGGVVALDARVSR